MVESSENVVLAQLRAIRTDLADVKGAPKEMQARLTNPTSGQASMLQHLGHLAAIGARWQVAADGMTERLARIERRLDLREI